MEEVVQNQPSRRCQKYWPTKTEPLLYLMFSRPGFKLSSWTLALQWFGHIQSKHEDVKSEVVSLKDRREVRPLQITPGGCYYVKRERTAEASIYSTSLKSSGVRIIVHLNSALSVFILSNFST